ncbi:MAG: (Fe-S)-binding protein [Gammaproteobacteria bacterium]
MTTRTKEPDRFNSVANIELLADACVKCGLCLPHCPTYQISGLEGESPRGRIALIQGLASGQLPPGGRTAEHLRNCTGCLTCQRVCPAGVRYGQLIDLGYARLTRAGAGGTVSWLRALARRPGLSRFLLTLLRWARRLGARRAATLIGIGAETAIGRIVHRLPAPPVQARRRPVRNTVKPAESVMIFTGCVTSSLDRQTLEDAIEVLTRCGYSVDRPARQVCCGALDLHDGDLEAAGQLATKNLAAFGTDGTPVLTLASGCAATLDDYDRLLPGRSDNFAARLQDVGSFLHEHWKQAGPNLSPIPARAALFQPCTVRNNPRRRSRDADLLGRIPSLDVRVLGPGYGCCGAAGHHFLTRAHQADRLLAPILDEIRSLDPEFVVTANVGCALHLAGALSERGHPARVLHPVSMILRSLQEQD